MESFVSDVSDMDFERLVHNVAEAENCEITKFFFLRSVRNQRLQGNKKIITDKLSLQSLLEWYLQRHRDCIHPKENIDDIRITPSIVSLEMYSHQNWNPVPVIGKNIKSTTPEYDLRRRKRIMSRHQGSVNSDKLIYTNYEMARHITNIFRTKANKDQSSLLNAFNTKEYFGYFAFPYFSPGESYDIKRTIGSMLWSVFSNQYLFGKPFQKGDPTYVRFENAKTFTTYNVERWMKSWRYQYEDLSEIPFIVTNSSLKYEENMRNRVFPASSFRIAKLSDYIMSFNFGLTAPPDVLPAFGWENLIRDKMKTKRINFKKKIVMYTKPLGLWRSK